MRTIILILMMSILFGCTSQQMQQSLDFAMSQSGKSGIKPTQTEVVSGLKEALKKGASLSSETLSLKDGFLKNQAVKILFPPEFQKVEKTLRKLGMSKLADQAIVSFNRAAENASDKAYPILAKSVTNMSIKDAMGILMGSKDSATSYLKKTTTTDLQTAFLPVVRQSANQVDATKYWNQVASKYNQIPFVKKVPADISQYITQKTLSGLFHSISQQEASIRENPLERSSALLKKVFGYAQAKK